MLSQEEFYMEELHECQRCGRKLKNAKAIKDGMGRVCKRKSIEKLEDIKLEDSTDNLKKE